MTGIATWTFTGQPYLLWPKWVQEARMVGRVRMWVPQENGTQVLKDRVVPKIRGQVVYPGERLVLTECGIEHEMNQ